MLRLPERKAGWEEKVLSFRHWRQVCGASTSGASVAMNRSEKINIGDLKTLESRRVLETTCMASKDQVGGWFWGPSQLGEFESFFERAKAPGSENDQGLEGRAGTCLCATAVHGYLSALHFWAHHLEYYYFGLRKNYCSFLSG